jgi:tetratricopeptide (TPR) repeat protein
MNIDELIAELQAAQGDPARLTLTTMDAVLSGTGRPELRPAVEAAAMPHWFDADILACLMETDAQSASDIVAQLHTLPMVETFPARHGWNVHEATRLALRNHLFETNPERFRRLSARAASCLSGDDPYREIEAVYHRLVADPRDGADFLRELHSSWFVAVRRDHLQSLAVVLEELLDSNWLEPLARAQCLLRLCEIREGYLLSISLEMLGREALEIFYDDSIDNNNRSADLRDCHCVIGNAIEQQGRREPALDHFKRCLNICRAVTACNPDNWPWRRELSIAHARVGRILEAQGKRAEALSEYEAFKQIMQELTARDPDNARWRRDLSSVHAFVGGILQALGKPAEALAEYKESKPIIQELTTRDPDNAQWRSDLSDQYFCMASILEALGKPAEALAECQESKRIMQELTARDPDNASWRQALSAAHNHIGAILKAQDKPAEALAEFEESKRIMQELNARDPDNAGWRRDLSVAHNWVGSILQAQDKPAEALAEFEEGKRIMQELTARDPDNAQWRSDLSVAHNWVGSILQAQGKLAEAEVEYEAARKLAS